MSRIHLSVHGAEGYRVIVGKGVCEEYLPALLSGCDGAAAVTDENVLALYGQKIRNLLPKNSRIITVPAGEDSKKPEQLFRLWNAFSEAGLHRASVVAAIGGGTVGDLAGFAAATYLRGVPCVEIPTTLLSMTDSCVGGKTGIDLPGAKNAAGTFTRPRAVLVDPSFLDTLPERERKSGMGEIVKYGFITPGNIPEMLENGDFSPEELIAACLRAKIALVEQDEFDRGGRMALNFGHTIGHAVEQLSGYRLPHGVCVVFGCLCVLRAFAEAGLCDAGLVPYFYGLAKKYSEIIAPDFSAEEIYSVIKKDKKASSGTVTFVYPDVLGHACLYRADERQATDLIRRGLRA